VPADVVLAGGRVPEREQERLDLIGERHARRRPRGDADRDRAVGLEQAPDERRVDVAVVGVEHGVGHVRRVALARVTLVRRALGESARLPPECETH